MTKLSIRTKLIALVLAATLPLFALGIHHSYAEMRLTESNANTYAMDRAQMVSTEVDKLLHDGEQTAMMLSEIPEVKGQDWDKCNAIFSSLVPLYPRYENIVAVDSEALVRCSGIAQDKPAYAGDRFWFREVMKTGKFTVGEVQIGRITKKPVVVLAYPLRNSSGSQIGVVGVPVSLLRMQEIFEHLGPQNGTIALIDEKGVVVASSVEPETMILRDVSGEAWFREIAGKESEVLETEYFGVPSFVAVSQLQLANWYAVVGVPSAQIYAPVWQKFINGVLFSFLVLAFVVVLSTLLGNRIIYPVFKLAHGAKELGAGKLAAQIKIETGDEIEELASSFNQMVSELKERGDAVQRELAERRRAEEALRRSEASLAEAQRIAHLGSWELDIVKNELRWSDEIYRIFDMKPQEFGATYEAFLDAVHPDDRVLVNKAYTDSVKNKTPYNIVHRLLLKDGTLKYVREKCETFYDKYGKPLRSIGTVQDVTERERYEEELKKRIVEFERMHRLMVGREFRMKELKEQLKKLEER